MRARYMQTFAKHVDRLPSDDRHWIRTTVSQDTWVAIDSAGLLGWIPVQTNLDITRAVAARLGAERTQTFFHDLLLATLETPLLRGFVQAVLRVAVQDPGLYLPWVARGYELVFRDTGRWAILERKPGWALLEIRDLPSECVSDTVWLKSVAASFTGLFDLTNLAGTFVLRDADMKTLSASFAMKWVAE